MIVSKSKTGFTLIEAMIAIALIAIVMTPILVTQGTIVKAVTRVSLRLQRIFLAQNFFLEGRSQAMAESKFSLEKKIESPLTTLTFERKPIETKSSLITIKHLMLDTVQASWEDEYQQQKELLVSLHYNKPQSKS